MFEPYRFIRAHRKPPILLQSKNKSKQLIINRLARTAAYSPGGKYQNDDMSAVATGFQLQENARNFSRLRSSYVTKYQQLSIRNNQAI
jgi:hypothetical protein